MFKSKLNVAVALVVCALLLPAAVSAKEKVTRPLKVQSDAIVVFTGPISTMVTETGEATHLGRFSSVGYGTLDPVTYTLYYLTDWTAANGDILHFEGLVYDINMVTGEFTWWINFLGGTGRFESATGGFGPLKSKFTVDPVTGVMIFSYKAEGTITY